MPHRLATLMVSPSEWAARQGSAPAADLFGTLLDRFMDVVGPAASEATFHYASVQEGLRIGAGHGPNELATALARVDGVLGHRSRLLEESRGTVRISVAGSDMLASTSPVRHAVVRGMLEGMLRAVRGVPYVGRVMPGHVPGESILEFVLVA